MTIPYDDDSTLPTADPADRAEQAATATRDAPPRQLPDLGAEAAEADLAEQAADAGPGGHTAARTLPLEADEADAAEQAQVVELEDDERR